MSNSRSLTLRNLETLALGLIFQEDNRSYLRRSNLFTLTTVTV
jgi:hypothetical protein